MISSVLIICFSTYLIWKVSASFDEASSFLTRNLSEGIKGPTVNAVASSLPELLISFFFLFYIGDVQGFSAGYATIIGSSIFNIAIIPTLSFLIIYFQQGVKLFDGDRKIIEQDGIFLILTEIVLLVGLYFGGISIHLAVVLLLLYALYITFIIYKRSKSNNKIIIEEKSFDHPKNIPLTQKILHFDITKLILGDQPITKAKAIIILIISLIIISISCKQLVTSSEHLSKLLNINLFFVTFFIAAVASSIPDTILSIKDAKNKRYKDAFSNAYGSNIFDICIGIGLPVLIYLMINNITFISIEQSQSNFNILILSSSVLLIIFTILITSIYWLKPLNITRTLLIIFCYLSFLGIVYYLS